MKKGSKSVFFTLIIVILFVIFTATFGIDSYYGDIRTVYFRGVKDINWGIDIGGGTEYILSPPEGVQLDKVNLSANEITIKNRLSTLGIDDYSVLADYDSNQIILKLPNKNIDIDFALNYITKPYKVVFREGNDFSEDNIIFTNNNIKEAIAGVDQTTNKYKIDIALDKVGKQKLSEASSNAVQNSTTISMWIDDSLVESLSPTAKIKDGELTISSNNFTANNVSEISSAISSGTLSTSLQVSSSNEIDPILNVGVKKTLIYSTISIAIIISLLIIAVYRVPGIIAVIAIIGHSASCLASSTGYLSTFNSKTLNLYSIIGFLITIVIGLSVNTNMMQQMLQGSKEDQIFENNVKSSIKNSLKSSTLIMLLILIISLGLMAAFGPYYSNLTRSTSWIFSAINGSSSNIIYSFANSVFVGTILSYLFNVIGFRLIISSFSKFAQFYQNLSKGGRK